MRLNKILTLSLILIFISTGALASNQEVKITINGIPLKTDVPAQVVNGSTLVPMRAILEKFEFEIQWNNDIRAVTADKIDVSIKLIVDSNVAIVNNEKIILDQPAKIIDNRTMVPIRFLSEILGANVDWDGAKRLALISGLDITDGSEIIYYDNGALKYKGQVKNNKSDGSGTEYYENGNIKIIGAYKNGVINGEFTAYYENGNKFVEGNAYNNMSDGHFILYNENGNKIMEANIKDDMLNGKCVLSYKNGFKSIEANFRNDMLDGAFILYYENGKKLFTVNCKNDDLHDNFVLYHENGSRAFEQQGNMNQDKIPTIVYYENGNIHLKGTVYSNPKNGERSGTLNGYTEAYYENGGLAFKGSFLNSFINEWAIMYDRGGNVVIDGDGFHENVLHEYIDILDWSKTADEISFKMDESMERLDYIDVYLNKLDNLK